MTTRFADFEVDWRAMELRRAGIAVAIKPKAFEQLQFLYDNRARVVGKEEIFENVWHGRIVSDSVLSTTVNDLRQSLEDTQKPSRIVRTHYGRGLRFIADVQGEVDIAPTPAAVRAPAAKPPPAEKAQRTTAGLAVPSFENLSGTPEMDRRSALLADDLSAVFSRFQLLSVASRTSSIALSDRQMPIPEIGQRLGVHYVCTGNVRGAGDSARIAVQLIDVERDQNIWASQHDWEAGVSLDAQDALIGTISSQVIDQISLHEGKLAQRANDDDPDAWTVYHRANAMLVAQHFEPRDPSIMPNLERAIELAPRFSLAHALLSFSLSAGRSFLTGDDAPVGEVTWAEADLDRAEAAARLSMELDSRCCFAWISLSRTHLSRGDHDLALWAARTAVSLNPNLPAAQFQLGKCYWRSGQPEPAITAWNACVVLGTDSMYRSPALALKALALTALCQHDQAVACSRDAHSCSSSPYLSLYGEISALGHLGRRDAAQQVIRRAREANSRFSMVQFDHPHPVADPVIRARVTEGFELAALGPEPPAPHDAAPASPIPSEAQIATPRKGVPAIVILPFRNMTEDAEHGLLAIGMTEDLITELTRFRDIVVMSRNASDALAQRRLDSGQIGRESGIRYVLEGSVRRAGQNVRVSAQLTDTVTGSTIWADRFDRKLDAFFQLQDALIQELLKALIPTLQRSERARAVRTPPENMGAWENFQRGLWHMYQRQVASIRSAIGYFERALELAPSSPERMPASRTAKRCTRRACHWPSAGLMTWARRCTMHREPRCWTRITRSPGLHSRGAAVPWANSTTPSRQRRRRYV